MMLGIRINDVFLLAVKTQVLLAGMTKIFHFPMTQITTLHVKEGRNTYQFHVTRGFVLKNKSDKKKNIHNFMKNINKHGQAYIR